MVLNTTGQNITPFGGIHIIDRLFSEKKLSTTIDRHLGVRSNCKFDYSDIFKSMWYTVLCGGDCAEDTEVHMKGIWEQLPGFKSCSADTILNIQKELCSPASQVTSSQGNTYPVYRNEKLNKLLMKLIGKTGVLQGQKDLTLDFDQVVLPTDKKDARYSYKNKKGYFPAVGSIGDIPVYVEGRNGNTPVSLHQQEAFAWMFSHLGKQGLEVKRCRMDAGSYNKDLLAGIDHKEVKFYVRANCSHLLKVKAAHCEDWTDIEIKKRDFQTCSFDYRFGKKTFRVVAYRRPDPKGQTDIDTGDHYRYQFIITNDRQWNEKKIIGFYNQRGASEKLFDVMNNDFNCRKMPFSQLGYNSVYLCLMAMCKVIYQWCLILLSKTHDFLNPTCRLKKFIFRFIAVAAKTIKTARRKVLKLYTNKKYTIPDTG